MRRDAFARRPAARAAARRSNSARLRSAASPAALPRPCAPATPRAAGFAPGVQHVVGDREGRQRNAEIFLGAREFLGAERLAVRLSVPALVGAPKPMMVLQAISVGLSDFCARAIAAAIAFGIVAVDRSAPSRRT